jgi:predicted dehydrogenase
VYPLSLAQALFGRPARVRASALLGSTGVDEQVSAILDYEGGRQAIVGTSLRCQLANAASIHGTEGILTFEPPLYFPHRYAVTRSVPAGPMRAGGRGFRALVRSHPWVRGVAEMRARLRTRSVTRRTPGSGYASEATEVQRCLRAGERESPEMTLDDTLAVLETLDEIRRATQVLG